VRFLQASECYFVPGMAWFFHLVGCIPVRRGGRDVGAIRTALQCLSDDEVLALFPEGDVARAGRGGLAACKTGAALLALRSDAAVIPAWIEGGPPPSHMLREWLWPSAGVRVSFGPAIDLSPYRGRPLARALLHEVTDLFAAKILAARPLAPSDGARPRPAAPVSVGSSL
jgi:1-acyl-sn-glycerol-3-phosphate acyltransferase